MGQKFSISLGNKDKLNIEEIIKSYITFIVNLSNHWIKNLERGNKGKIGLTQIFLKIRFHLIQEKERKRSITYIYIYIHMIWRISKFSQKLEYNPRNIVFFVFLRLLHLAAKILYGWEINLLNSFSRNHSY